MKQIALHPSHAGIEEKLEPIAVRTLNPPEGIGEGSANANSLALQLNFHHFSALLVGDLEKSGEATVCANPDLRQNQLLKVAHHGSRSATSDSFLDRIQSRWAIVSVGRNNPYGHPSHEVLARLRHHGARALSTMDNGAITFETDGTHYRITGHTRGV
jgi:competence protein ComEC